MVQLWVGSSIRSGWPAKNTAQITSQSFFASGKKKKMEFGSGIFRDRPSQKILTRFVMSSCYGLLLVSKKVISVIGLNYN